MPQFFAHLLEVGHILNFQTDNFKKKNHISTGLAKNFVWIFPYHLTEKPERTFWLTQYVLRADRISVGKESACKAGNPGLIPGSGRSLEEEMATHSSIPVWRIPWTEEPGYSPWGHKSQT